MSPKIKKFSLRWLKNRNLSNDSYKIGIFLMVIYDPMVLETHGITYRNPSTKNSPTINKHAINSSPPK